MFFRSSQVFSKRIGELNCEAPGKSGARIRRMGASAAALGSVRNDPGGTREGATGICADSLLYALLRRSRQELSTA